MSLRQYNYCKREQRQWRRHAASDNLHAALPIVSRCLGFGGRSVGLKTLLLFQTQKKKALRVSHSKTLLKKCNGTSDMFIVPWPWELSALQLTVRKTCANRQNASKWIKHTAKTEYGNTASSTDVAPTPLTDRQQNTATTSESQLCASLYSVLWKQVWLLHRWQWKTLFIFPKDSFS